MAPTAKNSYGFVGDGKKTKKGKAPADTSVVYSHSFSNLIPGDVAVSIERAFKVLGFDYEEISTLKSGGMGGDPVEVPFVRTQLDDGTDIPYGTFRVKGIGDIGMGLSNSNRTPSMQVTGVLDGKECRDKWNELIAKTKELAMSGSIFKNRAVRVSSPQDLLVPVQMDLSADQKVFFNKDIEDLLYTCVLWPISNRALATKLGIRTKRGALLDGNYGCGKSLFLYNAAKLAKEAGWTVLSMDPGMISAGVYLAPMLEPVCLIVEDVDAGAHGNRDYLNALLNSLSSVTAKCGKDMILLVSTNF